MIIRFLTLLFLFLFGFDHVLSQVNSWQQTNGPYGGQIQSLLMAQDGFLYAGTSLGKFFRSTNEGNNWTQGNSPWQNTYVNSMTYTSSGGLFAATSRGLFLSTDHGDNWTQLVGIGTNDTRGAFSNTLGHVFVGTPSGVFRSTDGGNTWLSRNSGLSSTVVRCFAASRTGVMFVGTLGLGGIHLFRSTNNGDSWNPSNNGMGTQSVLSLCMDSSGNMLAGTLGGVYVSTNEGIAWQTTGALPSNIQNLMVNSVGHVYATPNNSLVYRSTDLGGTWTSMTIDTIFSYPTAIGMGSINGHMFLGMKRLSGGWGGVFRSSDTGVTWTPVHDGMTSTIIPSVAFISGHLFCGIWYNGIMRSTNAGSSWNYLGLPSENVTAIVVNSLGYVFAGTDNSNAFFLSTDNGMNWTNVAGNFNFQTTSVIPTSGGTLLVAAALGINKTTDNGNTWTQANAGLSSPWVRSLAVTPQQHLFAGSESGEIYRSVNEGGYWFLKFTTSPATVIAALASNRSGIVFAAASDVWHENGMLLRSTDDGESWVQIYPLDTLVSAMAINSVDQIFVATRGSGILRSTNNGDNWVQFNNGLETMDVLSLAIDSTGFVYAGTYGGGVYRTTMSTTSVTSEQKIPPNGFQLVRNFPNPFNPSTTISFELPQRGNIQLNVYNSLGQFVRSLVNEQREPGIHSIVWDGRDNAGNGVASGTYFYQVHMGDVVQARKMVLLK